MAYMGNYNKTSLRSNWDNPFRKQVQGSRSNTEGNRYRSGMKNVRSMGRNIQGSGGALSSIGSGLMQRFQNIFDPAIGKAQQYADVSEQEMVDEASLDVSSSFEKAAGSQRRQLARYGVSPTSGKFQGATQDLNLLKAAAEAGARNKARIKARDLSYMRNMGLARLASGMPSQAMGAHSQAASATRGAADIESRYSRDQERQSEERSALEAYNEPTGGAYLR